MTDGEFTDEERKIIALSRSHYLKMTEVLRAPHAAADEKLAADGHRKRMARLSIPLQF